MFNASKSADDGEVKGLASDAKTVIGLLKQAGASEARQSRSALAQAAKQERSGAGRLASSSDEDASTQDDSDSDGDGSDRAAETSTYVNAALKMGTKLNNGSGRSGKASRLLAESDDDGSDADGKPLIVPDDPNDLFAKRVLANVQWEEDGDEPRSVRR